MLLEYDGTRFAGSQLQPGRVTVQGELENAIRGLLGRVVATRFAGRTDAGVHARGQVASFDHEGRYGPEELQRALNARLPEDIAVREAREAPAGLDVRRSATGRWYRYRVLVSPQRSPLSRQRAWQLRTAPDIDRMQEAAAALPGRRDFRSFAAAPASGRPTVRTVTCASVTRRGPEFWVDIAADSFLPHQVRLTVGALVKVGLGRGSRGEFERLLREPRTGAAGPMAPPQGLYLMRVTYEGLRFDADEETPTDDLQPEGWGYQARLGGD